MTAASLDRSILDNAYEAWRTRAAWSAFSERPEREPGAAEAATAAGQSFAGLLGAEIVLDQPADGSVVGEEVSAYTRTALGVRYPGSRPDDLMAAAREAGRSWRDVAPRERVQVCLAALSRLHDELFLLAHANTHTTGQSFAMSAVGSGTNALDRGLEALAVADAAMARVPGQARWSRQFGRTEVTLDKQFRVRPRGTAVVVTCASFPTWNAYPALLANLATGNPVVVKPHPTSVLVMALAVRCIQDALQDAGHPRRLVQLAVDAVDAPVTTKLVTHPDCAIVDFTGSPLYGGWLERNLPGALVLTETAGVNTVVLHSVDELEPVVSAIAGSFSLFSAQMCTSAQNVYLPADGLMTSGGRVGADEVEAALVDAVRHAATDPRRAASTMGAVQADATVQRVRSLADQAAGRGRLLLEPGSYPHPEHPQARTCTPAVVSADASDAASRELYGEERFGPVSFVVRCADDADALVQAVGDVARAGAIASHVYSTDEAFLDRATDAYWDAGASVSLNLTGPMPLNFSAAYSDFHVTGLSPAGNACLTDEAFVTGRFRVVQSRRPTATKQP